MVVKLNKKIEVIKMEETLKLPEKLQKQIEDYELKPAPCNQDEVSRMMLAKSC